MEPDEIERRAPGGGPEAVHARLRATAELLDDRPEAGVERAAREMLGRLDTLQAELDRLLHGLEQTAEQPGASVPRGDGDAGTGR
jgi:hypothetical protein